jgi:hypothetical protein
MDMEPGHSFASMKAYIGSGMNKTGQVMSFLLSAIIVTLLMGLLLPQVARAACSPWMDKAVINEYAFGGATQNYFETYSSDAAFPASWANWKLVVYRTGYTPVSYKYVYGDSNVAACTKNNKTWLRYSFTYNNTLDGNSPAVVELWDANGDVVSAFAFSKKSGTNAQSWISNTNNATIVSGDTGLAGRCSTLANRLSADVTSNASNNGEWSTANMVIFSNVGNKEYGRTPDGPDGLWGKSSETGSNTIISDCTSNNTALFKTTSASMAPPGGSVTFTVSLKNTGSSALNATVTDAAAATAPSGSTTTPPALVVNSATPSTGSGTATVSNNNVTWSITSLPAGSTASMTVVATVPSNAEVGTVYKNTASTSSVTPTQTDSASVTVISPSAKSFLISADKYSSCTTATTTTSPAAPIVTLTAMSGLNGTGSRSTDFTGSAYLNTSTGNGTWSIVPGKANGTLSGNVYTFAASDSGQAQFYLVDSVSESIGITATAIVGTSAMTGLSPADITYGSTTLSLANDDTIAPTSYAMIAGRPHKMKATLLSCGGGAATTGSVSSKIWYTTSQYHPSSAAVYATTDATCSTGKVQLFSAAPVSSNLALSFTQSSTSLSNATFYVCTTDVGQYLINMNAASSSAASQYQTARPFALTVSGIKSTTAQVVNPGGSLSTDTVFAKAGNALTMTFDAWRWPSSTSSASTLANADGTLKTSGSFTLSSVSAAGRTTGFASSGIFKATLNTPSGGTEGILGSTSLGSSGTVTVPLSSGTKAMTDLYYSEVGSFLLQGTGSISGTTANNTAVADYLGVSGLSVPTIVFKSVTGTETWSSTSNVIGRFTPDRFKITGTATLANRSASSCSPASSFSYMGETFTMGFQLTAQNSLGATTTNYSTASGFARLSASTASKWTTYDTTSTDVLGLWGIATNVGNDANCVATFGTTATGTPASFKTTIAAKSGTTSTCSGTVSSSAQRISVASSTPAPSVTWTDGVGQFSGGVVFNRASSIDGPYDNVKFGIWPKDLDSITLATTDANLDVANSGTSTRATLNEDATATAAAAIARTTSVRYGRLRLTNQYGSELLPLYMPLTVQYYKSGTGSDGSKIGWTTSTDDSCTANSIPTLAYASAASTRNKLASGQVTSYLWNNATSAFVSTGTATMSAGGAGTNKPLKLSSSTNAAKGPGVIGYVDVSLPNTPLYLQYPWSATRSTPEARAIFGIPTTRTSFVREMY